MTHSFLCESALGMLAAFIVRLIGFAALLGIAARVADALWVRAGLDGIDALQPLHDRGLAVLFAAPLVLALLAGLRPLRPLAVFAAFYLVGAALTAPAVLARAVGAASGSA